MKTLLSKSVTLPALRELARRGAVEAPAAPLPKDIFTPRFWLGCDGWALLHLMLRGGLNFEWGYRHMIAVLTPVACGHSFLRIAQHLLYGERIAATRIERDPIFIIGHWRTGTTLLHEMMILDARHNFPTTHQCFDPHHFLLTAKATKRWCNFLIGDRRPMDQMAMSWDRPQEDEFALAMMGQASPYLQFAFPNNPEVSPDSYDLAELTDHRRRLWKATFLRFLKTITFADPRRLILKSPAHSCRIPTLLEMFPKARFIHIVRNPYVVFPSTVHMWNSIAQKHGFQTPNNPGLKERVLNRFAHLYDRVERTKGMIPPGQYHELRYEELVASPAAEIRRIYEGLNLDGFEEMAPRLGEYLRQNSRYETNKYALGEADRQLVGERWRGVIERYGYSPPAGAPGRAD